MSLAHFVLLSWLAKTAGAAVIVGAYWITTGRHQQ